MDHLRELFQRAASEGLIPFMLAGINGSPAKKNTVRILEVAVPIFIIIFTISYYGGKLVNTIEEISKDQTQRQVVDEKIINKLSDMDKQQYGQGILLKQAIDNINRHHRAPDGG